MTRTLIFILTSVSLTLGFLNLVKWIPVPNSNSILITGIIGQQLTAASLTGEQLRIERASIERQHRQRQVKMERQLECLARNVYYEARGEPYEGKIAVAQVTVNRARSGKFPDDVCEVVYQKTRKSDDTVICQFSWWCMPELKAQPISIHAYRESYKIAKQVLLYGEELPHLKQALFFHAQYIAPGWNRERVAHIGQHIFYK